jgi:hypothetical protein
VGVAAQIDQHKDRPAQPSGEGEGIIVDYLECECTQPHVYVILKTTEEKARA